MGAKFTKDNSFAKKCEEFIKESRLCYILEQEHRKILQEKVFNFSYDCEVLKFENYLKCRYLNILSFNDNRVILPTEDGESDFINASYVNGFETNKRFLCTEAPLKETVPNFWKMIFIHRVRVIVMLTKIVENQRKLCYPYWSPKKGGKVVHGKFTIKTLKIKSFRYHVVTSLRVKDDTGASLDIKHFAYTDWPRDSFPQDSSKFLDFVLSVRKAQSMVKLDSKDVTVPPMVVHSSSGLNRTGAFCTIDICLSQYDKQGLFCLSSTMRNLRKQIRNCLYLPQHYILCYLIIILYIKYAGDNS